MTVKTLNRSFAAGEISPQLFSRLDLDKFQTGLAQCLNCESTAQGPVQNRPGFQYILQAKDSSKAVFVLPFSYSTQQTFALEFGEKYLRFHTNGGTLLLPPVAINGVTNAVPGLFSALSHGLSPGKWIQLSEMAGMPSLNGRWFIVNSTPSANLFTLTDLTGTQLDTTLLGTFGGSGKLAAVYEIDTPYAAVDLVNLHYVQSADVMTLVHHGYPPRELRRNSATNWSLDIIQFASTLSPPQSNGATPSAITHTYMVVPILQTGPGQPSLPASCSNDLTIPGRVNAIGWTTVPGAVQYYVYKQVGLAWGFIGIAASAPSLIDDSGITPNTSVPVFSGTGPTTTATATAVAPFSTGVSVAPTGSGSASYTYCVTSLNADASEESIASAGVTVPNDLSTAGNYNTVRWPAVPGVGLYNVYRSQNGIFGFIGRAGSDCIFVDRNFSPDTSTTPPIQQSPFQGAENNPRAVSYHQQRRVFGGTNNQPQNLWMTRSGTEKNMGYSFPSRDDDSISLRVVSREANSIRHIVPMGELVLLTSGGEWQVSAADTGALTPSNVSVKPQGYTGASMVQPVVTNRTILFAQDRGGHIRELEFSWQQQGYQTSDVSILAPHLFDYHTVQQLAFVRSPLQSLWVIREDGVLLGMTYVPEHEIRAWHQHTTDGAFESICAVAEGDADVLYAVVRRVVNNRTLRYIERRHTRRFDTAADQFFVDSGISYTGIPATTFSGLDHLEGKTVSILADGGVSPPQVVVNGSVSIDAPASKVHIGLPYRARVQTLPLSVQTQAFGQGTMKNIDKVHVRVIASNGFTAGPSFDKLRPYPTRLYETPGLPPALVTGEVPISLTPSWQRDGSICFEQAEPLSMTILGMALEVATGS
jgi:hypothetical protein